MGNNNTALGQFSLLHNTTGNWNTAVGTLALSNNITGSLNTALGVEAGSLLTTGSHNIHIGNQGDAADDALIRIGTVGTQTRTFIAGIFGATVLGNGVPV